MTPEIVKGDLLKQKVEVIVNPWNRNIIPWWLLLPQGVSGAIKKQGGLEPFRELAKKGPIPLGGAVLTNAGKLPFKAIIHVAGINSLWFATKASIQNSVMNAMSLGREHHFHSLAFPVIGSGSGQRNCEKSLQFMLEAFGPLDYDVQTIIVQYEHD